ncbi:metallophosphoesterase family protein [Pseudomonadota bacterium]
MRSFVKRLLGGNEPDPSPTQPAIPAGRRLYSIGDIHGRLDLLQNLHRMIEDDACDFAGGKVLIYLGDYIDRGEQSKEVIDHLLKSPLPGFETVYLLGNHEQTLLDFLEYPKAAASWLSFGGRACLASYGVEINLKYKYKEISEIRDILKEKLPDNHLDFFHSCKLFHVEGSYCFVHAGIRPQVPLGEQRNEDLLWIRDDFTNSHHIHDHVVVHGHSISQQVQFLPNRIGIDTGAYQTGVLTALVLEGKQQRLLQTGANK